MKKAIVFALLALMMSAAQGQQFEWAKAYGSTTSGSKISNSVTDADGNIYIIGEFINQATWDGEDFLPMGPFNRPVMGLRNAIIAKVSPDGEMLWKKVIISNNGSGNVPYGIKMVGDTSIACLVQITMPTCDNYTYYLDTLLMSWSDYPVRAWGVETHLRTAYILFDFEGNVKEQHFLHLSYTDANGDDIVTYYDSEPWYGSRYFYHPSFDIDAYGNIYICREAVDRLDDEYDASSGTIKGVKYWVDNRVAGWHPIENNPPYWVPILMKFSPHFDTLLAYRYVVQKWDNVSYTPRAPYLMVDSESNVYLIVTQQRNGHRDMIVVDSTLGLSFCHDNMTDINSYLVKTNSRLEPQWLITLDDSVINPSLGGGPELYFHDVAIDYDSNLLFITGTTRKSSMYDTILYSIPTYQGIPLSLKNNAFFLAFKMGDTRHPELYSYGEVNAKKKSYAIPEFGSFGNIACGNNRIFFQSLYLGGVRTLDTIVNVPDDQIQGMGLHIFDYSGHPIGIITYTATESTSACYPAAITLDDSVMYLSASILGGMTFGEHTIADTRGWQGASIAKYVDPAFMLPYVYTGPSDVRIVLVDDGEGAFVVYPNPFRSSVKIKVDGGSLLERDGAATATLTDMQGRQEQVRLTPEGSSTYRLDLSTTRTFRQSGNQAIFLTLTTSAGKQHTVRLLQQADLFGE